jgi:hypothetical protein
VLVTQYEEVKGVLFALQYPLDQLFVCCFLVVDCQSGGSVRVLPELTDAANPESGL